MRVNAADTVIFLDMPRRVCLYRVIKRALKFRGRNRPDMAVGCPERLDLEFLEWVWNYPKRSRPRILAELSGFSGKEIITLRSAREAEDFIRNIQKQPAK